MSSRCDDLQQILLEQGPPALRQDADAQQHLVECTDCFTFMEALWEVDVQLRGLPEIDAPEATVAETLARVRAAAAETTQSTPTEEAPAKARRLPAAMLLPLTLVARWVSAIAAGLKRVATAIASGLARLVRSPWFRPLYLAPALGGATLVAFFAVVTVGLTTGSERGLQADLFDEPDRFAKVVMQPEKKTKFSLSGEAPTDESREQNKAEVKQKFSRLFAASEESGSAVRQDGPMMGGGGGGTLAGRLSNVIGSTGSGDALGSGATASNGPTGTAGSLRDFAGSDGIGTSRGVAGIGSSGRLGGGMAGGMAGGRQPRQRAGEDMPGPMPVTLDELTREKGKEAPDSGARDKRERDRRQAAQSGLFRALSKDDGSHRGDDGLDLDGEPDEVTERHAGSEGSLGYGSGMKSGALASRTSVSASTPVVMGALPKEIIQRVISKNVNQVRTCYEVELQRHENLSGKVTVKFVIAGTGSVARVMVAESTLANRQVETCIRAKIKTWRFPAPAGGGIVEVNYPFVFRSAGDGPSTTTETVDTVSPARALLAERAAFDDVQTREATGYWANTYVPGDPALRLLHAQLRQQDRTWLQDELPRGLRLDQAAGQLSQPFDAPQNAALGVYLHADRRWAQGKTRALVQVGIKGTPRYSGSRPAMNLGIVLDLRGDIDAGTGIKLRALVEALSAARDTGDRFHLVVAGRPGALMLPAEAFRHGPIKVALQQVLDGTSRGERLDLVSAMQTAVTTVIGADDPTSTLGSSAVLLVTSRRIDDQVERLTALAHDSAVNGVPVSVVGVGDAVDVAQLDRVTLAGQGNRRLLTAAAEARRVVDRELSAVARVVARAVRLRIRLAPGVELVDVLGSYRLDEVRADEVRQAEVSIDRRLSRNLGVQSDRGEDEDGIQIVIPSYYAGDTHVVLLDVILPGPGPVADVRARFKDLVFLRNGVARSNLTLGQVPRVAGPLELNVLKNYIALHVAHELTRASRALASGDGQLALDALGRSKRLLTGLRAAIPALATDRDLGDDLAMLEDYSRLLALYANHGERRDFLADSLRYSGLLKLLPRPLDN